VFALIGGRFDGGLDLDAGGYSSIHGVVSLANFLGPLWSLRRLHFSSGLRTRPLQLIGDSTGDTAGVGAVVGIDVLPHPATAIVAAKAIR